MKNSVSKLMTMAVGVLTLTQTSVSLHAFDDCWYAGVDAVLFEHCGAPNYYAMTFAGPIASGPETLVQPVVQHHIDCKYKGGFRVFAGYHGCDCLEDVRISWLYLDNSSKAELFTAQEESPGNELGSSVVIPTISNPNVFGISAATSVGNAQGRVRHQVNVVDLDLRYTLHCYCCFKTRGIAGLRFFYLRRNLSSTLTDITDSQAPLPITTLADKSESWGLGPRIGFETTWNYCNFDILVGASGALLAGSRQYVQKAFRPVDGAFVEFYAERDKGRCICTPAFDARVELGYSCDMSSCCQSCCGCCCWDLDGYIGVGYEYAKYFGATQLSEFVNGGNLQLTTFEQDYGYQGFYLRFALNY